MTISERSWHLRYVRWVLNRRDDDYVYTPKDLCSYFWGGLVLATVSGLLFALMAVMLAPFWIPVVSIIWLWGQHSQRRENRRHGGAPAKAPNLVTAYLRARKERICPLIEVVP